MCIQRKYNGDPLVSIATLLAVSVCLTVSERTDLKDCGIVGNNDLGGITFTFDCPSLIDGHDFAVETLEASCILMNVLSACHP